MEASSEIFKHDDFRVRRYRWTILVLSAVAVYVVVLSRGNDSGERKAIMLLRHDQHDQPPITVTRATLRLKNNPNQEIVGRLIAESDSTYAFYEVKSRTVWLVHRGDVQSIALPVPDVDGREVLGDHRWQS